MEKDLQNLRQIFNDKFFRIPDYQRGYSWETTSQIEDFWEDLELLQTGEYHYTGMLTYEKIKKINNKDDLKLSSEYTLDGYSLVDGQQRLTTILILLKCILNGFNDSELIQGKTREAWENQFLFRNIGGYEYFIFGYDIDNPSDYFFKKNILERKVSDEEKKQETIYTRNLLRAKKYFEDKISILNKEEKIALFEKITNKLKFNTYEVDSDLEVFVTFETMNNRGKSLSKLELLKNRLIYLSVKLQNSEIDKEKLRDEINDSWKNIYHYLGKNQENTLDDDDFLKNHWIMYFPDYNRNEASAFSTFLLKEKFTIKNLTNKKLSSKDIKSYVESLKSSIENYFFILNPTFEDSKKYKFPQSVKYLEKLNRLGFSSFLPLIIVLLN